MAAFAASSAPSTSAGTAIANASLSLSGLVHRTGFDAANAINHLFIANPAVTFDVLLAFGQQQHHQHVNVSAPTLAQLRAVPNVRHVRVLTLPQEPSECTAAKASFDRSMSNKKRSICIALWRQAMVHQALLERVSTSGGHHYDLYIHTRFDAAFDRPVLLRRESSTLYVARSTWFLSQAQGNIDDQLANPITWRGGKLSLRNSVPDYAFMGTWQVVSPALVRYYSYLRLMESVRATRAMPQRHVLHEPELFLSHVLRLNGIEFGSPDAAKRVCFSDCRPPLTYQILFMHAAVSLL